MQQKRMTGLRQGLAVCVVWVCGMPMLKPLALAQTGVQTPTGQEAPLEKASKPKKPKKSNIDTNANASQAQVPPAVAEKKGKAPTPVKNASDAEIQSAKSSGMVWVNTDTGVYHKGGKWFGATKQGKFMTEQDAVKAGYKPAKNEK
jgi:hypothetical protein